MEVRLHGDTETQIQLDPPSSFYRKKTIPGTLCRSERGALPLWTTPIVPRDRRDRPLARKQESQKESQILMALLFGLEPASASTPGRLALASLFLACRTLARATSRERICCSERAFSSCDN